MRLSPRASEKNAHSSKLDELRAQLLETREEVACLMSELDRVCAENDRLRQSRRWFPNWLKRRIRDR